MVEKGFVAAPGDHIDLVRIPELCEDGLDVALVHVVVRPMFSGTLVADEGPVRDIGVRRLVFHAVHTVGIKFVLV